MICNVGIISAVQQSESAIHIHTSILQILFPYRLSQNIGQSSLRYTASPCGQSFHMPQCAYAHPKPPVNLFSMNHIFIRKLNAFIKRNEVCHFFSSWHNFEETAEPSILSCPINSSCSRSVSKNFL